MIPMLLMAMFLAKVDESSGSSGKAAVGDMCPHG
jgi:hypothetical protein